MNILSELTALLETLDVPFETGHYSGIPPDEYAVIVPLTDRLELFADNQPHTDVQEARLSLYCRNNYMRLRNRLTKALLESDFTVTDRRYIGMEDDTKYHHYAIDVVKNYELGESEINTDDIGNEPEAPEIKNGCKRPKPQNATYQKEEI